jgi:hypothetical protein
LWLLGLNCTMYHEFVSDDLMRTPAFPAYA